MMLVWASTAGAGVGNFGSEGSDAGEGTGCAKAGSTARNAPAKSDNVSLFFILLPFNPSPCSRCLFRIVAPQPFQRRRQCLPDHPAIGMARVHGKDITIVITLLLEHFRHAVVG